MLCHIVQNGGYMFLILCLLIFIIHSSVQENIYTIQEFCSANVYIHNIDSEEPYTLTIKTEVSSVNINKWHKSKRKCRQEFKTSASSAHFVVYINNMSIPSCNNCRCNYFEISVPGNTKRYCGSSEDLVQNRFNSKSDKLSIEFHPGLNAQFDVTLKFVVQRNVYYITSAKTSSEAGTFIETPYFPTPYPPNYGAEYIFQPSDDSRVLLLFLDFQISHQSFIEVYGNNGTHPSRFYGNVFRPPVIVSQFNSLTLKFVSNDDQPSMAGFRALAYFVKNGDSLVIPYTDCSGSKDGRGGYMNIKTHEKLGLYDCVWHIMPFFPFTISNRSVCTHLENVGHKSNLEFRSGLNSKSKIVNEINCGKRNCNHLSVETVIPASENLYIRFSGYLDANSVINITYSTYHTGDCSSKEFRCDDGRCLLSDFRCDGIKQCPNGTDEELCPSSNTSEGPSQFHPNIYPESIHNDMLYKKFMIVVLIGTFGLLTVCVLVSIFIYNRCRRNTTAEPLFPQRAVGEMPAVPTNLFPARAYDSDPPSYEDFIKSSDCYPPLLYTRSKQPMAKAGCTHCTTSFCTGARMRHYSADSFNLRNLDSGNGDIFLNITGDVSNQPPPPRRYNVEIIQNSIAFKKSENIKRSFSLDSKLNDTVNQESCHFLVSIIHPVSHLLSNQSPHTQCQTLPPNFKMSAFKSCKNCRQKMNFSHLVTDDSNVNLSKDRRFTWSFVPRSSIRSEILTVVKTKCFSDPCKGISVHCSLY